MCWTALNDQGQVEVEKFIEERKRLRELGFSQVITNMSNIQEINPLQVFGEKIIPEVFKL